MTSNKDRDLHASLGDQVTFQGQPKPRMEDRETRSLGDQVTFGGCAEQGNFDDGSMEIVDFGARYRIEGTLGKGGMGEVLLANDTRLDRKVAIKRILGDAARNKTAVNRFLTEAKSIAALNHPNVVQIHDYGRDHDGPFIVMEFIDGNSLLDLCRDGALPMEEAIDLACQVCDGLGRAHDVGIIHRDIKPANILLTADGMPKLTDFGLAKAETADAGITMAGAVLGTLDFIPPEQRRDASVADARSDLWSLAATLYQMVTGESPRVIDLDLCPQELRSTLRQCLKTKPEQRFQSARDFKEALRGSINATKSLVPQPKAVDPGAGECPSCHSFNESHRKFCRCRECGDAFRCNCLKCQHEIPVWDKVCPECGGKQADLAAKLVAELSYKREHAEQLRSEFSFEAAISLANEVAQVNDRRTFAHRDWAVEFAEATGRELARQLDVARLHFDEAQKHRAVFDYAAAIQAIEAIPKSMRSQQQSAFLASLESERSESAKLMEEIEVRVQNREMDELLPLVEKAALLLGGRDDLRELTVQLREHEQKQINERDDAFRRAESLLSEGNAGDALNTVKQIHPKRLTPAQNTLFAKLERISMAERELREMFQRANADGVIDAAEVVALIPKAMDYSLLNPNNLWFLRLKDDLLTRTASVPVELLRSLPQECIAQLPSEVRDSLSVLMNSIGMQLKLLPAGRFTMGDSEARSDETSHQVALTHPFYLGVYQVTQEQYQRVMGNNPSHFKGARNPVEQVSWGDAAEFCRKLSALPEEKSAGRMYRLPTEAEWEYACRAGSTAKYCFGNHESQLSLHAWYDENSGKQTQPVGEKKPNAWGLFDMHGNVWEWCADWYCDYIKNAVIDPVGPREGSGRVSRGGCWRNKAALCRAAYRCTYVPSYRSNDFGFRLVMSPYGVPV